MKKSSVFKKVPLLHWQQARLPAFANAAQVERAGVTLSNYENNLDYHPNREGRGF